MYLPLEIIFKILYFCDIITLRKLRKISEFSQYHKEIDRILKKEDKKTIMYHYNIINNYLHQTIQDQINYEVLGFQEDGDIWSDSLRNIVQKSISHNRSLIEKNLKVEQILLNYRKSQTNFTNEVPIYHRISSRYYYTILNDTLRNLLLFIS